MEKLLLTSLALCSEAAEFKQICIGEYLVNHISNESETILILILSVM